MRADVADTWHQITLPSNLIVNQTANFFLIKTTIWFHKAVIYQTVR